MKRKIRLMAMLWPLLYLVVQSLAGRVSAQDAPMYGSYVSTATSLSIGDSVPASFYRFRHEAIATATGQSVTLTLDEHRNKLVILDFWATWCGGCIHSLNQLDSISKTLGRNDLVVIPVTYQRPAVAEAVWKRWGWDYTAIVRDSLLGLTFPTSSLPHQVWIKDGRVIATPRHEYATSDNIRQVLSGADPGALLFMKEEAGAIDPTKPAFVTGNGQTGHYHRSPYSVIARHLPGYRFQPLQYGVYGDTAVLVATNNRFAELLFSAFRHELFPPFARVQDKANGILWDIPDELKADIMGAAYHGQPANLRADRERADNLNKRTYGYNLRYPKPINDTLARKYMQEDLNTFFGLYYGIEAVVGESNPQTYAVLRLSVPKEQAQRLLDSPADDTPDSGDYHFARRPFELITAHANISAYHLPGHRLTASMVDSTGIDPSLPVNARFPKAMRNGWTLDAVNRELDRYGLTLTIETKKVPVLIIRRKGHQTDFLNTNQLNHESKPD